MKVFISHSLEDEFRFDDLCHALERENVPYWNPKEMRSGASLREQLQNAIEECVLCIFLATRKSVESSWCSAELGAFWGSKKDVIVYVADDSLSDDDIPPQFKGDLWLRKLRDVVEDAKKILQESNAHQKKFQQEKNATAVVGKMSVGALVELLRDVIGPREAKPPFSETMSRLATLVMSKSGLRGIEKGADLSALVEPHLSCLIGESIESLKTYGKGTWDSGFSMTTSSGHWTGYSCIYSTAAGGDVEIYSGCLVLHVNQGKIDGCAIASQIREIGVQRPTKYEIDGVVSRAGEIIPGEIISLGAFSIKDNESE